MTTNAAAGVRGRLASWDATPDGQRIALCMIVRDEEAVLARALASAAPWVDEIVVVDTGSDDATVEVAEAHGARVGHFAWCDSFAAARNAALGLVTADWILVLDADEEVDPATAPALREIVRAGSADPGATCFALPVRNLLSDPDAPGDASTTHRGARVFRRAPGVAWTGDVHETVVAPDGTDMRYVDVDAPTITHHGYAVGRDVIARKSARNLALLERAHARDVAGGYYAFKLAQHAISEGRRDEATLWLRRSVAEAGQVASPARFVVAATELLARDLIGQSRTISVEAGGMALVAEAEAALVRAIAHFPAATALWLRLAEVSSRRGDDVAAARLYASILARDGDHREALIGYASAMRDDPPTVLRTLDRHVGAHGPTDTVCAWRGELLRTTGRVQEAYDFLDRTVQAHPAFIECRATLANLLDDEGAPAEAVHVLSPALDGADVPPLVYDILGRALTRMGRAEAAHDAMTMAAARRAELAGPAA